MFDMILYLNESLVADMCNFARNTKTRKTSSYSYVGSR